MNTSLKKAALEDIRCHRENGVSLNPFSTPGARSSWERGYKGMPLLAGGHKDAYDRGQIAEKLTNGLAKTDPRFQAKIRAITAAGCCMTEEEVYDLWREYSRKCDGFDQSPVLFEFVQWYEDRLGANLTILLRAIEDT